MPRFADAGENAIPQLHSVDLLRGFIPPTIRAPNAVRAPPTTPAAPDRVGASHLPAPLRALGASRRCAPIASVLRRRWPGLVGGNGPSDGSNGDITMQNIVILAGNIGQDPESRTTQG